MYGPSRYKIGVTEGADGGVSLTSQTDTETDMECFLVGLDAGTTKFPFEKT